MLRSTPRRLSIVAAIALVAAACGGPAGSAGPSTAASSAAPSAASPSAGSSGSASPAATASPSPSASAAAGDWIVVTPEGAGFSVSMPGEPEFITQSVETAIGAIDLRLGTWEASDGAYAIAWGIYPDAVLQADPADILEGARDGTISNTNGTLVADAAVTLHGIPGRRFSATVPGGNSEVIVLLDGTKFIQLAVVFADGAAGYDPDRYFESFTVSG